MEQYLGDIWFVLWAVLWGIYFVLDGYDFGIGMLIPVLGFGNERESKAMYEATGPFWDANEVWLITAGGVTFAAFPNAYAVLFSSLYTPLLLLLLMLIMRGVAAEFRSQWNNSTWRFSWDLISAGTGFLAALLLGVAFSNLFRGLPLDANQLFQGNILNLLHPFALLGGILFVLMFLQHGALFLGHRTAEGFLHNKARYIAKLVWPLFLITLLLYVVLYFFWAGNYVNFVKWPWLLVLPLAVVVSFLRSGIILYFKNKMGAAFKWSGIGILSLTLCGVAGMYPNLIPSRLDPAGSLNIANAASTPKTLTIMLIVAVIFVPLVIGYQWWIHKALGDKIETEYK